MITLNIEAQLKSNDINEALAQLIETTAELLSLTQDGNIELIDSKTGETKTISLAALSTMLNGQAEKPEADHPW